VLIALALWAWRVLIRSKQLLPTANV
jgi:hypothetical protein